VSFLAIAGACLFAPQPTRQLLACAHYFMVAKPRQSFSGSDVPMRRCPTWFLPWIRPLRWCHDHKTVLIGAGVAAISFNSRMFLTISRLSRAAMDATIPLSRPIMPGAS
jgi:hypothetical protein